MARILLAEDNALNRRLYRDILTSDGHEVVAVGDGAAALEAFSEMTPDLVLLDLQLPICSGHMVVRAIRDDPDLRHLPVVAVSAFATREDKERALENGFTDFIAKPAPVDDVLKTVTILLDQGVNRKAAS